MKGDCMILRALGVAVAAGAWSVCTAAEIHVAPGGSDTAAGTGSAPLATLQAGVNRLAPGDTLLVHGGIYRETVAFPRSGAAGMPITLKPFKGAKVVVSGCDPVGGWTRHTGAIWKASMPWTLGTGRNQAFVGGRVASEARYPNTPAPGLEMYVGGLSPLWPVFGEFSIPQDSRTTHPGRVVSPLLAGQPDDHWKGALYYGVHYEGWCGQSGVIESSRDGEIRVGDRTRGWWFGSSYGAKYPKDHEEGRGTIVGHMNALDAPGEWHWQDGVLYLIPEGGGPPKDVEAKRRQVAFDLSGREHIRIEGLDIRATSLRLDGSAHCVVDGCRIEYVSHFIRQYAAGQVESGRDTIKSGETGIFLGGHHNAFLNCSVRFSAGAGFHLRGHHQTIHNCLVDEVSYTAHYLNAITDAVSDYSDYENLLVGGHTITFNTLRNAGRHFFNFYGNGTSLASRDRAPMDILATLFAHNHLYNGMLQTRDAGFMTGYFSSGGTLNGLHAQVAYNAMHDCYDLAAMRWNALGIVYLDAGTSHVDLHHNLLWAAPGSLQRGMWFNTACVGIRERDNVFHPDFARTSAQLEPGDFPGGRPFRFGHDFAHPPVLPVWPPVVSLPLPTGPGPSPVPLRDGDCLALGDVDLDAGWQSAVLRFAGTLKTVNSDRSARARPRHRKATDPLALEAIASDGTQANVRAQWTFLHSVSNGAWVRFVQVPLGDGYRSFRAVYGSRSAAPRRLEIRLDRVDGPLAGRVELPQTDRPRKGWVQIYGEAVGEVSAEATGTRDVFLVFHSDDGGAVGEFEYFRFEQSRGRIPLQRNEVKLEIRAGGKEGARLGEFYPRPTGGTNTFWEFVCSLGPARGKQPLFLVVRSALTGTVGAVDGLCLQKAGPSVDVPGLGVPPRRGLFGLGGDLLPEATHLPRARPSEKYNRERVERRPGRPLDIAAPRASPPTIDGRLGDWPAGARALELAESYEGTASPSATGQVWIAYDRDALLVAARLPCPGAAALRSATHRTAPNAYAEVAFRAPGSAPRPTLVLRGHPDGHMTHAMEDGAAGARLAAASQYAAGLEDGAWVCEWRIPFAACGFTPRSVPRLEFNFAARESVHDTWSVWSGTGGSPGDVANAGTLVFPAEFADLVPLPKAGLELWFDAADPAAFGADDAGRVALWRDKSGHGRNARQDKPAHRPVAIRAGMNGRTVVRFDEASATRMNVPDLAEGRITATVFAVISNPVRPSRNNASPRVLTASDGKAYDYLVGIAAGPSGFETGGPRQMAMTFADRWAKEVRIGCFSPNYQTYFTGDIAEILVYGRALVPAERDTVRAYLESKWGL